MSPLAGNLPWLTAGLALAVSANDPQRTHCARLSRRRSRHRAALIALEDPERLGDDEALP